MVGRAVLVRGSPLGGACCVAACPPRWWCLAWVVIPCWVGCRCDCVVCLAGVDAVLVRAPPLLVGACRVCACPPPPLVGRAVSACSGFRSRCCSGLDARRVFLIRCCLKRRTAGIVGCWLSVVVRLTGTDEPASQARVVCHPVFLFRGCRRPAARVSLLALRFLVSARLLAVRCAPVHPTPLLVVCGPPLCFLVSHARRRLCPRPPPGGFVFCGRWGPAPRLPLLPLCFVVALRRSPVCRHLLLSRPPPPGVCVSRGLSPCRSSSSVLPLPSRGFAPLGRLFSPPVPPVFFFLGVVALPLVFP